MKEYDIIIVGGGPAGSSAAKVAAQKGMRTVILEKRTVIGLPRHCEGRLVATTGSRLTEEVLESMPGRVVLTKIRARRIFSPSGKLVEEIPLKGTGARLILRDLFDLELARQAANAGSDILLKTRVTSLLKENGTIKGVQTDSKDIEPDVIEFHLGSFSERGDTHFFPQDEFSVVMDTRRIEDLDRIRDGNWLISRKLRDAVALRMTGWTTVLGVGGGLPRYVKDGLILAGSAAGFLGILSAVFSGRHAAEVAVEAIEAKDIGEGRLRKYEGLVQKLIYGRGEVLKSFYRMSDQQIEDVLPEMIQKRQLQFWDTVPF
jgi:digeranylgeranylglycerophospholipid reductase